MSDLVYYDAFISYSTQDAEFVTALRLALELNGRRIWQDVKELEVTEEWWMQIKRGIAQADNFVFVVSPRSLASPICHLELEHARQLNKRVIFIRHEAADKETSTRAMVERLLTQPYLKLLTTGRDMFALADQNWQSIEAEQSISIPSTDDLLTKVPLLAQTFDKDLSYLRQGTLLLGRATEWQTSQANAQASFALRGEALRAAETWLKQGKQPAPTPLHQEYIQASQVQEAHEQAESARIQAQIADLGRATRRSRIASAILAVMVGLAILAVIYASSQVISAQNEVQAANTQVAVIIPTVTQAAMTVNIAGGFANIMLQQSYSQISAMNDLVERYPEQAQAYQAR